MIIQFWLSTSDDPVFHEVSKALYDRVADLPTAQRHEHGFEDRAHGRFGAITIGGLRP